MHWRTARGGVGTRLSLCWSREDEGADCAKQAGLCVGAGPLRWVVVERAGGVERAGI
jgi:hypothetical protein